MGFFDFLKPKEQKNETIELSLDEVAKHLSAKEKQITQELASQIKQIKSQIEEEKAKLSENAAILQEAQPKNKNVLDRARQIMEGNRVIYLQKVNSLQEKITLPENPEEILEFAKQFDKDLGTFEQGIGKSHSIMEEFFVEKASVIAKSIKAFDKLVKDAKSAVENSQLQPLEKTKGEYNLLMKNLNKKENSKKEIAELKKKISSLSEKSEALQENLKTLNESKGYSNALNLIKEKESLENQLTNSNAKMSHHFSELETALKKYENMSENKLAKKYLEDSLAALSEDKDLEILGLFEAISSAISNDQLILKDKKKDKTLKTISTLNKDYLENFLSGNKTLNQSLAKTREKLESEESLKKSKTLQDELEKTNLSLIKHKSILEKTQKDLADFNKEELTRRLEIAFKEYLSEEIKIT